MNINHKRVVRTATYLLLMLAMPAVVLSGQKMESAVKVPLDFLEWIGEDQAWVEGVLSANGGESDFTLTSEHIESDSLSTITLANRIRAFSHLAAPGRIPPYVVLTLTKDAGQTFRCATTSPGTYVPDIKASDFGVESFATADVDPLFIAHCQVDEKLVGNLVAKGRDAFRQEYFDSYGDLMLKFREPGAVAAYVAAANELGYFTKRVDASGALRIE